MSNLNSFINEHLDIKRLGEEELGLFAEAHIALLKADNPGNIYSNLIKDIENSCNNYLEALTNKHHKNDEADENLESAQRLLKMRKLLEMDLLYNAIMITQENLGDVGETKKYFPLGT